MQTPTVLIVEDEPHIAAVVAMKLQQGGLRTAIAADAREALAIVGKGGICLVVSDINLPGTSGVELAMALAEGAATKDIPILLLTGMGHTMDAAALACPSVRGVLAKPFSPRELLQRALAAIACSSREGGASMAA